MRTSLLGMPVDVLSLEETVARARIAMREREACRHVALNVAKLVNARSDPELDRDVRLADIIGIDGMGIVLGLKALGMPGCERVSGIDLFLALIELCAIERRRPFLLGATRDVLDEAAGNLAKRFPGLEFAGLRDGYFGKVDELEVVAEIRRSGADCLFIAMPTPRKERFLAAYGDTLGVPFLMGIGGSLDVVAGKIRRAPAWAQSAGLEWAYRLAQEPRRLAGRYLRTNAVFAGLLALALVRKATGLGQTGRSAGATRRETGTER